MGTLNVVKPDLRTPFPGTRAIWTDPITGLRVPKSGMANLKWRTAMLEDAEQDESYQQDLLAASSMSLLFWINTFCWTYHQFDVGADGIRMKARFPDVPFITWDVQDDMLMQFVNNLDGENVRDRDILVNKSRDMGASWCCTAFMHWLWLFRDEAQLLELSRTEPYVDQAGNMKALFQKHDYMNKWLPTWMLPPDCLPGQKYRTKMHMKNTVNGSCIDGESTTKHAASGDRRLVILLDEFAKVEHGREMRSATRDAGLMRIVNSTVAGPGTEYSKWKNSGQIKVFSLMWWEHPEKGKGRYVEQDKLTGGWKIRSSWYDNEESVRSPQEMAREIDAEDMDSGDLFFSSGNVDKHIALFSKEPTGRYEVDFTFGVANDMIAGIIAKRELKYVKTAKRASGPLSLYVNLVNGRLDQHYTYIFGVDISKGQGASNSVVSIKCKETKIKVGEWVDANTPPYDMARVVVALAIWVGGRTRLPFIKWENNGPGWDFGRLMVKKFCYPFYYRAKRPGGIRDKKTRLYGWQSGRREKEELLRSYDRVLAHGGYVNPSKQALEEARQYIYFDDGSIGPACLVDESPKAKKTHGDRVIADALTLDDDDVPVSKSEKVKAPYGSVAWRKKKFMDKRKTNSGWRKTINLWR